KQQTQEQLLSAEPEVEVVELVKQMLDIVEKQSAINQSGEQHAVDIMGQSAAQQYVADQSVEQPAMNQPTEQQTVMEQSAQEQHAVNMCVEHKSAMDQLGEQQFAVDVQAKNIQVIEQPLKDQPILNQLMEHPPTKDLSESSEDNVPLLQIQKKLRKKDTRKRKRNETVQESLASTSSDHDDSDLDANYTPSDECFTHSDEYTTPVVAKRKRKWMRKRIRPLKRQEGRAQARNIPRQTGSVEAGCTEKHQDRELQDVLQKSKEESDLN
ncbi:MAG: hypothetical protein N0E48_24740, partial [Candidatus Thiodiazotropha endolucinida]|nr:hypothetical protein [Candidatus Thiodiazotropha taylori]MCW4346535.1 hypothetical protein [Candidatus Thiodiazotropha endolucinida]